MFRFMKDVLLLSVIAVYLAVPSTASAALNSEGRGEIRDGAPEAVVVVGRSGEVASWRGEGAGSGGGGRVLRCAYYGFSVDLVGGSGVAGVAYDDGPVDPEAGTTYVFACFDEAGQEVSAAFREYDPGDPFAGVAATERALDEARRRLDLPMPEPRLNPPGAQLVGVATWLWLDGPWASASATAAVGPVAATVTARPERVVWEMGDGTTVTCGAGTPYDPARPPSGQHSDCTHVYTRRSTGSSGGTYRVTATVAWAVGWTATTGRSGDLGELERSTDLAVTVQEAQALIR